MLAYKFVDNLKVWITNFLSYIVYRLHKELRIPFATAHRDFARIHPYPSTRTDYCVEIKPKQGWWPKHLKHAKLCTYCLNQFLKVCRKFAQFSIVFKISALVEKQVEKL